MKMVSLKKITPHPLNQKIYSPTNIDDISMSISEVGLLEPLVVDSGFHLISGHRRYQSCVELGMEKVSVRIVDIKPADIPLMIVSHNQQRTKTAQDILNEVDILSKHYGDRRRGVRKNTCKGIGKTRKVMSDKIGVPESTISKLLVIRKHRPDVIPMIDDGRLTISQGYTLTKKLEGIQHQIDNLKDTKRRVRRRRVVEGKNYRIYTKSSSNMSELDDESIQTIFTSPPYYNKRDWYHPEQIGLEDSWEEYLSNIKEVFDECFRCLRSDGTMFIEMQDSYLDGTLQNTPHRFLMEVLKWSEWYQQNTIIWKKTNTIPQSTRTRFVPTYSFIFYLSKSRKPKWCAESVMKESVGGLLHEQSQVGQHARRLSLRNQEAKASMYLPSGYKQTSDVFDVCANGYSPKKDTGIDILHPATFPPQITINPILATSEEGDTILDPFSGVASTGAGAISLGRKYVGYEINPKFVDVSRERLNKIGRR
jgi:DNA modification methylase